MGGGLANSVGLGKVGREGGRFVFREVGACLKRVCGVSEWVCEGVFRGGGGRRRVGKTGVRLGVRGVGLGFGGG